MNADLLLKHFERISDAPGAVPRLRQFILDLAVRGKLAAQDPDDEPAIVLLDRIHAANRNSIDHRKIRSNHANKARAAEQWPFRIPASWTWCRLSQIGAIVGGGTPPSGDLDNFVSAGTGIAWLTPADLGRHSDLYISHGARD